MVKKSSWSGGWATLRDLEIIKTLIEVRTATLAAELLGISQPAISRTLSLIESRSGCVLFKREKGKLIPNSDALSLYEEIVKISDSFERLTKFEWNKEEKKSLRIISTPTIAYCFLMPLTAQYIKENPDVTVKIDIVTASKLLSNLNEGRADIALGDSSLNTASINVSAFPLRRTKIVCAMNRLDELASKDVITPEDLNQKRMIVFTKRNISRTKLDRVLDKSGVSYNIIAEVSDSYLALDFVRANVGVCLMPSFPVSTINDPQIIFKDFIPEVLNDSSFFTLSNLNSPHIQRYLEYIYQKQPIPDRYSEPL
ncbi:LysR family transcriptional regulator [Budvicia aquatica]|uniref:Cys regulon transcriptional activator n=1 Tax=Budvicia aquatica TaxID=82979 RepID=A0A2C6DME0_9GAMM|nr:LysR family transcriptional regulator [Budvicia aquatica]MBP9642634.1 LysR family transcriptional regulator [Budvicia sp.]PHI29853.1 LysR family transcriptional regulator [Budvicia aquatica]GKX52170.1 LysR family transcriptional regulator [Budvicia aquatica]VFS48472.1 Cys regulon transcriptional activator [Budvicia aquatica]